MNKKTIVFLTSLSITLCAAQKSKDELLQAIVSAHTRAFGNENLIVKHLDNEGIQAWQQTVQAIKEFIQANAPELNPYVATLSTASDQLISRLQIAFNSYIAPKLLNPDDKKSGLSKLDIAKLDIAKLNRPGLEKLINPLKDERHKILDLEDTLTKKLETFRSSLVTRKIKGDAVEILLRLTTTLADTIKKTINDLQKLSSAINSALYV